MGPRVSSVRPLQHAERQSQGSDRDRQSMLGRSRLDAPRQLCGAHSSSRVAVVSFYALSIITDWDSRGATSFGSAILFESAHLDPLVINRFNPTAHLLCDSIREELTQYEIIGSSTRRWRPRVQRLSGARMPEQLSHIHRVHPCLEAAIATPDAPLAEQARMVELCEESRLRWWVVPWVYRLRRPTPRGHSRPDSESSAARIERRRPELPGQAHLRRGLRLDILIFAMPIIALAALAILIDEGRPIFFRQQPKSAHRSSIRNAEAAHDEDRRRRQVHREYVRRWISNGHSAAAAATDNGGKSSSSPTIRASLASAGFCAS